MADRRCFHKSIITSDAFLDMSAGARCLYFALNMYADDDGFVNSPRSIMRLCGSSEDDLKLLILKKFVICFDDGILVIKHWRIHNTIQKDRYTPTKYIEHLNELYLDENKSYTQNECVYTECIQNGYKMETQVNLIKDNIIKDNKKEDNINIIEEKNDAFASQPVPKHKYGTFKNILLTDKEHETLSNEFKNYEQAINYLSEYKEMKGYKCKSDYLAIRKWVFDALKRESIEKKKLDNMEQQNKNTKKSGNIFLNLLNEMEERENG